MATVTFVGGTSGDMTVGANYAGGVAPGGGDSVIFNTGSRTVTAGPGVDLVDVTCTSGWSGSFGTVGSPVSFRSVSGKFKWAGNGDACYVSFGATYTCAAFIAQRGEVAISGAGTVTALYVETANVNATVTALSSFFVMTPSGRLSIRTSATAVGTESWTYGVTESEDRNITTVRVVGKNGRLYTKGATALTTAHVQDGAILNSNSSGTITTANVGGQGSLITPVNNPYISSAITNLNIYSGGNYVQYANGSEFAITTLTVYGSQTGTASMTPTT